MPDVTAYNKCNNNCIMCTNPENYWKQNKGFSLVYLSKILVRHFMGEEVYLNNYKDSFSLTGGEPTLNPALFSYLKRINYLYPNIKITILSKGRKFSSIRYTRRLLNLGLNLNFIISICGHNAKLHDKITRRRGSFTEAVAGLKNILQLRNKNNEVEIRVVIHKLNYKFLIMYVYCKIN